MKLVNSSCTPALTPHTYLQLPVDIPPSYDWKFTPRICSANRWKNRQGRGMADLPVIVDLLRYDNFVICCEPIDRIGSGSRGILLVG